MDGEHDKTVAVIQARTGSSRLPGKVLNQICGQPMLWHQIQRAKLAQSLSEIIVATTDQPEDQPIIAVAQSAGVQWSTGSVDDVLDRVYQAVKHTGASVIVRLTGDCPLIDPEVIDQVVNYFLRHADDLDHVSLAPDWPEGYDTEAFSFSALEQAWREAKKQYEREHVTPYLNMSGKFRLHHLPCAQDLSHLRLTVDEPVDYEVVRSIYEALYPDYGHEFGLSQILDLLDRQPQLFKPNMSIQRNEGFLKSLKAERKLLRYDPKPTLKRTDKIWKRSQPRIPAGNKSVSKRPVQDMAPRYLQKGLGSKVWDVDGNEYIDYSMGQGFVILGHNYPRVSQAIQDQLELGTSFSLMNPLEVELAELLTSVIPWAEMVQFGTAGSDATTGAIRAARAYTGKEIVFRCGHHLLDYWCVTAATRNVGVPQGPIDIKFEFPYNDLASVARLFEQHSGQVAAIIMEPYSTTPPEPGFLEGVKELAHTNGAVLIYDEITSGFRFRAGGIHDKDGVTPDLACFGNAMGNGMPISAIAGPSEVMKLFDEESYNSEPNGDRLSLAASIATIIELVEKPVFDHTWEMGSRLKEGYNRMAWDLKLEQSTQLVGQPPLTVLKFLDRSGGPSVSLESLFRQEVLKRGILFGGAHYLSYSHSEADIDMTLAAYYEAMEVLKRELETGDMESIVDNPAAQPVFRPLN